MKISLLLTRPSTHLWVRLDLDWAEFASVAAKGRVWIVEQKNLEMNLLVATFLAFLPKRYGESLVPYAVPPSGPAVGGILEMLGSLGLLIHGYQFLAISLSPRRDWLLFRCL